MNSTIFVVHLALLFSMSWALVPTLVKRQTGDYMETLRSNLAETTCTELSGPVGEIGDLTCDPSTGTSCQGGMSWEGTYTYGACGAAFPVAAAPSQYAVAIPAALYDYTRDPDTGNSILCGKGLTITTASGTTLPAQILDICGCGCSVPNGLDLSDTLWQALTRSLDEPAGGHLDMSWKLDAPAMAC